MALQSFESNIGGRDLTIETGKLAGQANAAVTVRYGDTEVLVTVCFKQEVREGVDFLPLTIDYEERLYAAGKIPGGFIRREGRPSEEAILACRLTDRPIRPLLPKGWRKEIQLIVTVLSVDLENDPDILAVIGSSVALSMSEIPFDGPVGAVHVGYINGEMVLNPALAQLEDSQLDLVVVSTSKEIIMIEARAKEVSEDIVFQALEFGYEANQEIIRLQERIQQSCGKTKLEDAVTETNPDIVAAVAVIDEKKLAQAILQGEKSQREQALSVIKSELLQSLGESFPQDEVASAFEARCKSKLRNTILEEKQRTGGRGLTEIRSLGCEVGILPRTHGSALFTRGQTQVLSIATLGSTRKEQMLDGLGIEESKRFMHHYNFTPFSTGEVKRSGSTSRREIGHGALAERALAQVMPDEKEFPYTIRLVSEVLSSSGSTSMASVCAGSLSLMDAGIPVKSAVAGIAMGLVTGEDGKYVVLTDIEGLEDAYGDMDFKIAGTKEGITAIQMDTKLRGLSFGIVKQTLDQGKDARLFILDKMNEAISSSRSEVSRYAPRMHTMMINTEKIGAVIGPGGKTIRSIIEKTKTTIDINDDGMVIIGSSDMEASRQAIAIIEGLTKEVEIGTTYTGKVTRILDFGAMVEILPGKEGLVHISELADYRVPKVEDVVKIGDEVNVKVINIDNMGRINLSRRALLEGASPATKPPYNEERRRPENRNFPRRSG
ncbi:polyribonucleotide nucleotidyltransferase [Chloroflexota bacterium]